MRLKELTVALLLICIVAPNMWAQELITNVYGRNCESLNGKWEAIIDQYDQGRKNKIFLNKKPENKVDFYEYSFDGGLRLNVPSDWNSQMLELKYYEGTVWYARHFNAPKDMERVFLYFAAVSYRCKVYLNGEEIGGHEGGFTPFQIEVTNKLKDKDNFLAVWVNNTRTVDAIPAMAFDWWNYGGITRDVMLIKTPKVFVEDYFIQLAKGEENIINAEFKLSDELAGKQIQLNIPELKIKQTLITDNSGKAKAQIKVKKIDYWSPSSPKLYDVEVTMGADIVSEKIGFRTIKVQGEDILLNGEPVFMKSISFHEEIPQRKGRAFSEADAEMLLSEAKALGCNMIRLAHYPQNEYIVRKAEEMGFFLWEEIPIWQGIDFENEETKEKAGIMIKEMVARDKNRVALTFWGVANETKTSEPRNKFLRYLIKCVKEIDNTRLITAAFDLVRFDWERNVFIMKDDFIKELDVVAVNKYMGWYHKWPIESKNATWDVAKGQPLIISEFGGEAMYGITGNADVVSSWSEDYQVTLYKDNILMFNNISNLRGVSPWVLFDFRSPFRFHPQNQEDWNRKGLVSDQGFRKKAWYIMKEYFESK